MAGGLGRGMFHFLGSYPNLLFSLDANEIGLVSKKIRGVGRKWGCQFDGSFLTSRRNVADEADVESASHRSECSHLICRLPIPTGTY